MNKINVKIQIPPQMQVCCIANCNRSWIAYVRVVSAMSSAFYPQGFISQISKRVKAIGERADISPVFRNEEGGGQ